MSEYGSAFFKPKQNELADKMDLASYLLKPVQRMGKYALLLQQLMKACSNIQCAGNQELMEDLDEIQRAEEMVRFQLRHGNDLLAMDSLRDCDVNVKEQGRLLRQNEFLVWEGRGGKKSLRQVFLFEELVLFSKARRFPDRKVSLLLSIQREVSSFLQLHTHTELGHLHLQEQHQDIRHWLDRLHCRFTDEIRNLVPQTQARRYLDAAKHERRNQARLDG